MQFVQYGSAIFPDYARDAKANATVVTESISGSGGRGQPGCQAGGGVDDVAKDILKVAGYVLYLWRFELSMPCCAVQG